MYKGTLLKITNINMYNTSYPSTLIKDIDYKTKIRFLPNYFLCALYMGKWKLYTL